MLVPRRYGGFEFDVPTFVRVIAHLARGCPSTAWQVCLPTAHALLVASWFDERAQDELFADPDFLCPSVAAPVGRARRPATASSSSPAPTATARAPRTRRTTWARRSAGPAATAARRCSSSPRAASGRCSTTGAHTLGLKGSGSNSIVFDGGRIPEYFALPDTQMLARRQLGRHARPAPARQPDVRRPRAQLLRAGVHRARRRHGQGRARRVPRAHHDAHDPPPADRPARRTIPTTSAGTATRAGRSRPPRRRCFRPPSSGWRPAGARSTTACPSTSRRTCGSSRSRASRCACAGTRCRSTCSARRARAPPHDGQRMQRIWRDMSMVWGHLAGVIGDWAARGMATEHLGIEPEGAGPRKV